MTSLSILTAIDTRMAAPAAAIATAQLRYYEQKGRFAQRLSTHPVLPADGAELPPDPQNEKLAGSTERWMDLEPLPAHMMSALRMDAYQGREGPGYVLVSTVQLAGRDWQRCDNFGPEPWRTRPWQAVPSLAELMPPRIAPAK